MTEQHTCGKGIAARSPLPARMADVANAMAEIFAFHQKSLPLNDDAAAAELRTYARIEEQLRSIAAFLQSLAQTMADAYAMPMAPHDFSVLATAENAGTFGRFIASEQQLFEYLREAVEKDRAMLAQMH